MPSDQNDGKNLSMRDKRHLRDALACGGSIEDVAKFLLRPIGEVALIAAECEGTWAIPYCSHLFTRKVSTDCSLLISRNVHGGILHEIERSNRLRRLRHDVSRWPTMRPR